MKFLLVHSFYGSASPSGENKVVLSLSKLLKKNNHSVIECFFYSDHLPKNKFLANLIAGFSYLFNPLSLLQIQIKILLHKPDIIHIHNTFPLVSPFVFYLYTGKAKVVQTLHNYRYFCASAILKQPNSMHPCLRCIDEDTVSPAVHNKCYRESRLATLPLAFSIHIHKLLRTFQFKVDHFIVLSEYAKSIFHRAGIDHNIMSVATNPIELELANDQTISSEAYPYPKEIDLLYVGRLSSEKGVLNFLRQLSNASLLDCYSITIVGEGPEAPAITSLFRNTRNRLLPRCSGEEVLSLMKRSNALVIPSVCVEGLPSVQSKRSPLVHPF